MKKPTSSNSFTGGVCPTTWRTPDSGGPCGLRSSFLYAVGPLVIVVVVVPEVSAGAVTLIRSAL
jgi:hypothetical protein